MSGVINADYGGVDNVWVGQQEALEFRWGHCGTHHTAAVSRAIHQRNHLANLGSPTDGKSVIESYVQDSIEKTVPCT